jgi:protein-disulfide isomerase
MDRRFATILAVLLIAFVGLFVITKNSSDQGSSNNSADNSKTSNNIEGLGTKGVTLVEYGDYQCPVCGAYYQPIEQLVAQFKNDIRFQFRNLPLTSIHPNAFAAARAAQAAGLQNKYFEMHDLLYENQAGWSGSNSPQTLFVDYAKQIGLNVEQFKKDYASQKVNDTINADLDAFDKTGQDLATPTFFLNGEYLPNSKLSDPQTGQPSLEKMIEVIKAEIAKKNSGSSQ